MELSHEQIEHLFGFTEKQGVHYYDVQVELVDHLATKIEAALEADETLTFPEALKKAFDSFGVAGFDDVLKEKMKAATALENKLFFDELKQWFTLQRLTVLLCVGLTTYFLATVFKSVVPIWLIAAATYIFYGYSFYLLLVRKATRELLLLYYNTYTLLFAPFSPLPIILTIEAGKTLESKPVEITIGVAVVYFALLVTIGNVRRRLKKRAETFYPEAFAKPSAGTKV